MLFELSDLVGIVGHETDRIVPYVLEYGRCDGVISSVSWKVECKICIERVKSSVLQVVCLHFGKEANSSSFLTQIQYNSSSFFLDGLQGPLELWAAVTSQASQRVAGEAF